MPAGVGSSEGIARQAAHGPSRLSAVARSRLRRAADRQTDGQSLPPQLMASTSGNPGTDCVVDGKQVIVGGDAPIRKTLRKGRLMA